MLIGLEKPLPETEKEIPKSAIETYVPKIGEILNEAKLEFPEVAAILLILTTSTFDFYLNGVDKILLSSEEMRAKQGLQAFAPHLRQLTNAFVLAAKAIHEEKLRKALASPLQAE